MVIGGGHSGLAMSHELTRRDIDHVVLERGEVANSWRTERWDSLRLLTPNWQSRLPGYGYDGDDPDGFMTMPEVVSFISGYADTIRAPVETGVRVTSVKPGAAGYEVATTRGDWHARGVVLASGACNLPSFPGAARDLSGDIASVPALDYRNPRALPPGGVLVVGASATGLQVAEELARSGRSVTLAAGEHVRMPRTYRDRDIQWWMERTGLLDDRYDAVDDLVRARNLPSPQLVGTPERKTLDLNALTDLGVRLVGRLMGFRDGRAQFSGSLPNVCKLADLKLNRLLNGFDEWAVQHEATAEVGERLPATAVPEQPSLGFDLAEEGIRSVLWATGYRPDYSWLDVPVLDRKGRLKHDGGVVTDSPGMVALGLTFLRRRKSSFIHGAEDDARDLAEHLAHHLGAN
ncbi:MAG: NAD(P)-binding domain-containing protein [Gammaproteobacteria bacterium]|nr:NAD(P)-binding domain-containing protein [Gammaproteobacteria bacterium]